MAIAQESRLSPPLSVFMGIRPWLNCLVRAGAGASSPAEMAALAQAVGFLPWTG